MRLLPAAAMLWRIGRGKSVDQTVLEQVDGVTATMRDAVAEAARFCNQDALAPVEALDQRAVNGLRKDQLEPLSAGLSDHGCLDPSPDLIVGLVAGAAIHDPGHLECHSGRRG